MRAQYNLGIRRASQKSQDGMKWLKGSLGMSGASELSAMRDSLKYLVAADAIGIIDEYLGFISDDDINMLVRSKHLLRGLAPTRDLFAQLVRNVIVAAVGTGHSRAFRRLASPATLFAPAPDGVDGVEGFADFREPHTYGSYRFVQLVSNLLCYDRKAYTDWLGANIIMYSSALARVKYMAAGSGPVWYIKAHMLDYAHSWDYRALLDAAEHGDRDPDVIEFLQKKINRL
jgi:hypothetical protein